MPATLGTTDAEQPFEPGEVISWNGDLFVVEANHGGTGTVVEADAWGRPAGARVTRFAWAFSGTVARRVVPETRRLLFGAHVAEAPGLVDLTLRTHCPEKWAAVDLETGQVWMNTGDGWRTPPVQATWTLQRVFEYVLKRLTSGG